MAKRKVQWNESKIEDFIKEGRGQGVGTEYKPWIRIQDFPSMGRVSRIFGWKTKRIHHLFTDIQTRYFYLLEWDDSILDIREHYPLLDYQDVVEDKDDLDFALFTDKDSQRQYIISTTFLITLKARDGIRYAARSIKAVSELEKKRSLEKLEIERRYWKAKGIDWGIVTQKDIPITMARNIEWVHSSLFDYKERGFSEEDIAFMGSALLERIIESNQVIRVAVKEFDKEYNYETGTGLYVFKYLIASKKLKIDIAQEIDINNLLVSRVNDRDYKGEGGVIAIS